MSDNAENNLMFDMKDWSDVLAAIKGFEDLANCFFCGDRVVNAWTLGSCSHVYCDNCAHNNVKNKCLECKLPFNACDISVDRMTTSLVETMSTIKEVITKGNENIETTASLENKNLKDNYLGEKDINSLVSSSECLEKNAEPTTTEEIKQKSKNTRKTRKSKRKDSVKAPAVETIEVEPSLEHSNSEDFLSETKSKEPSRLTPQRVKKTRVTSSSKRNIKGETPLMVAIIKGDTDAVKKLLDSEEDVNVKDNAGWTPLHEASIHGHHEIVELLIKKGALVNLPGSENITALHEAVQNYHLDVVRLLVQHGADVNARDARGKTPKDFRQNEEMKNALKTERTMDSSLLNTSLNTKTSVLTGVLSYNLNKQQNKQLANFLKKFKVKNFPKIGSQVSHVILDADAQNLVQESSLYYLSILQGKWILSAKWIEKSLEAGEVEDPEAYEVNGTEMYPLENAPAKGRENKNTLMPPLFDGCSFYLRGVVEGRHEVLQLITAGGGTMLHREPATQDIDDGNLTVPFHAQPGSGLESTSYIILFPDNKPPPMRYRMKEIKSLPVSWLKECVETFSLVNPSPYLK